MKKIFNISGIIALGLGLALLSSCTAQELDTDQYASDQVTLVSFGPNPVMRGGTVRFFGSNLQKVSSVEIPGIDPITTIEVTTSGVPSEIRVQLPVDGPEVGVITLKTAGGKTLVTKTELTYEEPIVFDSFSTVNEVSYPGDVITLKGDYMSLVKSVIFEGGAVAEVTAKDRYTATAVIPAQAVTGKIIISDEGEIANLIYSEKELKIGDPTVSSFVVTSAKPGQTATVKGNYLNMIQTVTFAGDVVVDVTDFTVSEDAKTLSVALPATAKSGDVKVTDYAGKEFTAGTLTLVQPAKLAAAPQPVKAGSELTVSGTDLDLISDVSFPGAGSTAFTYADNAIKVTVPGKAKEGDITLTMANGDAFTTAFTLVAPVVASVSPVSLKAGEDIVLTGTDLDLVVSATLGGKEVACALDPDSGNTRLVLTTSPSSTAGKIVLNLENGNTIELADDITLSYDSFIIVNEMPAAAHIGMPVTLKGENFMMLETIYVGDAKVTSYTTRTDTEITFTMPFNKVGSYPVVFHLLNGDVETCPNSIEVQLELKLTTIWEGIWECGNWNGNQDLAYGAFDWSAVEAGTVLTAEFEISGPNDWHQFALRHGEGWGELPTPVFFELADDQTSVQVVLTQTIIDDLVANSGLIITGTSFILKKLTLSSEISQERTIWEGNWESGNWSGNQDLAYGAFDWSSASAGQVLTFYIEISGPNDWHQFALRHGDSWGELPTPVFVELAADQTKVEYTITQEMLDDVIANGGLIITGTSYILKKVTIL